jgi:hypothetical protein
MMVAVLRNTRFFLPVWIVFFILIGTTAASQRSHTVFFEGEENELHVYRINGSMNPGRPC